MPTLSPDRRELFRLVAEDLQDPSSYGGAIRLNKAELMPDRSVQGVFVGVNDGRSYSFTWRNGIPEFKPAVAKLDSESDAAFLLRWDTYTEEIQPNPLTRVDGRAKPKCGSTSYFCNGEGGGICLSVHKTCRKDPKAAINKERLNKINGLIDKIHAGEKDTRRGLDKPGADKLTAIASGIGKQRSVKASDLQMRRSLRLTPQERAGVQAEKSRIAAKFDPPVQTRPQLQVMQGGKPPTMFEARLKKGDLGGAIEQSLLEADQAKTMAKRGQTKLRQARQQVQYQARSTIEKYPLIGEAPTATQAVTVDRPKSTVAQLQEASKKAERVKAGIGQMTEKSRELAMNTGVVAQQALRVGQLSAGVDPDKPRQEQKNLEPANQVKPKRKSAKQAQLERTVSAYEKDVATAIDLGDHGAARGYLDKLNKARKAAGMSEEHPSNILTVGRKGLPDRSTAPIQRKQGQTVRGRTIDSADYPSDEALRRAIAKYESLGYNMDGVLEDLTREDAKAKAKADPKPCGKGWSGTKPPGCTRAGKGKNIAPEKTSTASKSKAEKTATSATKAKKTKLEIEQPSDLETLRKNYKEKDWSHFGKTGKGSHFSDVGNQQYLYADEIDHKGKPDKKLVAAFNSGQRNYTPALVIETGKDQYKAIGSLSQKIVASAGDSKQGRAWSINVPNDPDQIKLAEIMQAHPDKTKPIYTNHEPVAKKKGGASQGRGFSDTGNYQHLYTDEMSGETDSKKHGATNDQIEEAAKLLLKTGGRNWVPVLVHENEDGSYKVVGNHFAYAVAQKAGLERAWSVQVSSDKTDEKRLRTRKKANSDSAQFSNEALRAAIAKYSHLGVTEEMFPQLTGV